MSAIIGRGRYARATYPIRASSGGVAPVETPCVVTTTGDFENPDWDLGDPVSVGVTSSGCFSVGQKVAVQNGQGALVPGYYKITGIPDSTHLLLFALVNGTPSSAPISTTVPSGSRVVLTDGVNAYADNTLSISAANQMGTRDLPFASLQQSIVAVAPLASTRGATINALSVTFIENLTIPSAGLWRFVSGTSVTQVIGTSQFTASGGNHVVSFVDVFLLGATTVTGTPASVNFNVSTSYGGGIIGLFGSVDLTGTSGTLRMSQVATGNLVAPAIELERCGVNGAVANTISAWDCQLSGNWACGPMTTGTPGLVGCAWSGTPTWTGPFQADSMSINAFCALGGVLTGSFSWLDGPRPVEEMQDGTTGFITAIPAGTSQLVHSDVDPTPVQCSALFWGDNDILDIVWTMQVRNGPLSVWAWPEYSTDAGLTWNKISGGEESATATFETITSQASIAIAAGTDPVIVRMGTLGNGAGQVDPAQGMGWSLRCKRYPKGAFATTGFVWV